VTDGPLTDRATRLRFVNVEVCALFAAVSSRQGREAGAVGRGFIPGITAAFRKGVLTPEVRFSGSHEHTSGDKSPSGRRHLLEEEL
jgi:hypothetical protein